MKFDLHTHHHRCGHAVDEIESYIRSAIDLGLSAIGISDHSPYFAVEEDHPSPGLAMAKSEFPRYIEEVVKLKKQYEDKIEVLIGVESDYFTDSIKLYADIYRKYPIDYLIGSIHISGGKHISDRGLWTVLDEEQLEKEKFIYFDLLQQAAKSGVFQIIGHMDLIRRYYKDFMQSCGPLVEKTMQVFAETGAVYEVNTSGIERGEGINPCREVLEIASHYGVKVTFGSDSHRPVRVGEHWHSTTALLKQLGYKELIMFRNLKPVSISI
ncbi:histidinol-phosphatase [Paenibacillus periandrae]|uniref:histidinol-phosphatase n=1 Tax=Paenibacillus periandrae TaxID=1761741 RepID=UPI001F08C38A|nr:histidinol-phosphatase [Paenibacillus periandrae]